MYLELLLHDPSSVVAVFHNFSFPKSSLWNSVFKSGRFINFVLFSMEHGSISKKMEARATNHTCKMLSFFSKIEDNSHSGVPVRGRHCTSSEMKEAYDAVDNHLYRRAWKADAACPRKQTGLKTLCTTLGAIMKSRTFAWIAWRWRKKLQLKAAVPSKFEQLWNFSIFNCSNDLVSLLVLPVLVKLTLLTALC